MFASLKYIECFLKMSKQELFYFMQGILLIDFTLLLNVKSVGLIPKLKHAQYSCMYVHEHM
jgi:hypothetical protein